MVTKTMIKKTKNGIKFKYSNGLEVPKEIELLIEDEECQKKDIADK